MRKLLIFLFCATALSGCHSDLDLKFRELDKAIASKETSVLEVARKSESLRQDLSEAETDSAKWETSAALFYLYKNYQADSAMTYLDKMAELAGTDSAKKLETACEKVIVLALSRKYAEAGKLLSSIDTSALTENQMAYYLKTDLYLDGIKAVDELIPGEERKEIIEKRHSKRSLFINSPAISPFEAVRRRGMQLYESGQAEKAVEILKDLVDNTDDLEDKSDAAYTLAFAYAYTGNRKEREYWLAQSAIWSSYFPNRSSMALFELSNMLFEDNQLAQASRYCQVALEDALASKYNSGILNSANSMLSIVKAVGHKTRQDRRMMLCIIVILATLFLTTCGLLALSFRLHHTIKMKNILLEKANEAKTGYITRHITMSAYYMEDIERYRHDLRVALKTGGVDAVKEMLRKPPEEVIDYKSFYRIFDDTFIGLFPDFVDKVNDLLKPEARIYLKDSRSLTTVLRILAAIKLGVTDSGQIAKFLHCAPSSVYTHRCKIKKMAACPPEEFEKMVAAI